MCVAHSDKPTNNYHQLCSSPQLYRLFLRPVPYLTSTQHQTDTDEQMFLLGFGGSEVAASVPVKCSNDIKALSYAELMVWLL